jgi:subtilisin-like proprotein convertase family protein
MNSKSIFLAGSISVFFLALGGRASAGPMTLSTSFSSSLVIPDNDPTGVADTRVLSMPGVNDILSLQVSIDIGGGFNGDYYAYLRHGDSGFAVLLNRPGLAAASPYGYADRGFNITLSDTAPNSDVHLYQTVMNPNGGTLTGLWQPDGRNADPSIVSDSFPRTAMLDAFNAMDPNGSWTLFVSDNSALGIGTLAGWGLTVTADVNRPVGVPEGGGTFALLMLGLASLWPWRLGVLKSS